MPEKKTIERAKKDKAEGKSPSTQAGEFVREEIHHVREGKHGARSPEQAIAIGLSKARRAGVKLGAPKKGTAKKSTRAQAKRDLAKGKNPKRKASRTRARATTKALKREPRRAATSRALSRHSKQAASRRRSAGKSRAGKRSADEGGRKTVAR